jgi:L-lactate dehydrogenase complex protein LldG
MAGQVSQGSGSFQVSAKEEMLDRIRKALGHQGTASPAARLALLPPPRLEGVMPPIADEDRVSKFEAEFKNVAGCSHRASTVSELEAILQTIIKDSQSTYAVLTRNPLLREIRLAETWRGRGISMAEWPAERSLETKTSEPGAYREQCFSAGIGFSGVDYVLAETGSLILTSETEGSQLASLAPPVHVAFYRRHQVLASLDDALEKLSPATGDALSAAGRSVVFVTGTSRTADIEQILIRGDHGPREVHAIWLEESCLTEFGAQRK